MSEVRKRSGVRSLEKGPEKVRERSGKGPEKVRGSKYWVLLVFRSRLDSLLLLELGVESL